LTLSPITLSMSLSSMKDSCFSKLVVGCKIIYTGQYCGGEPTSTIFGRLCVRVMFANISLSLFPFLLVEEALFTQKPSILTNDSFSPTWQAPCYFRGEERYGYSKKILSCTSCKLGSHLLSCTEFPVCVVYAKATFFYLSREFQCI